MGLGMGMMGRSYPASRTQSPVASSHRQLRFLRFLLVKIFGFESESDGDSDQELEFFIQYPASQLPVASTQSPVPSTQLPVASCQFPPTTSIPSFPSVHIRRIRYRYRLRYRRRKEFNAETRRGEGARRGMGMEMGMGGLSSIQYPATSIQNPAPRTQFPAPSFHPRLRFLRFLLLISSAAIAIAISRILSRIQLRVTSCQRPFAPSGFARLRFESSAVQYLFCGLCGLCGSIIPA